MLDHLQASAPAVASGQKGNRLPRRFKVCLHAVDSSVMELVANCIDWAKHRRRKAAAKKHLRLDLHRFWPSFAIVETAVHHNNRRAGELCATEQPGEVVISLKVYIDFEHLIDLDRRGV